MYRTPTGRTGPRRDAEVSCIALKVIIFDNDNDSDILYIIPLITRLLAKTKKLLHKVCLFTIIIRSVDQQRNGSPKTSTS